MSPARALREHWPEYLIEGWALGCFMLLAPFTGLAAGVLVAACITFEAPLSGMSMNAARSLASAAPASQ